MRKVDSPGVLHSPLIKVASTCLALAVLFGSAGVSWLGFESAPPRPVSARAEPSYLVRAALSPGERFVFVDVALDESQSPPARRCALIDLDRGGAREWDGFTNWPDVFRVNGHALVRRDDAMLDVDPLDSASLPVLEGKGADFPPSRWARTEVRLTSAGARTIVTDARSGAQIELPAGPRDTTSLTPEPGVVFHGVLGKSGQVRLARHSFDGAAPSVLAEGFGPRAWWEPSPDAGRVLLGERGSCRVVSAVDGAPCTPTWAAHWAKWGGGPRGLQWVLSSDGQRVTVHDPEGEERLAFDEDRSSIHWQLLVMSCGDLLLLRGAKLERWRADGTQVGVLYDASAARG